MCKQSRIQQSIQDNRASAHTQLCQRVNCVQVPGVRNALQKTTDEMEFYKRRALGAANQTLAAETPMMQPGGCFVLPVQVYIVLPLINKSGRCQHPGNSHGFRLMFAKCLRAALCFPDIDFLR